MAWVFDPTPPSGSRTGGSSAQYCFDGNIDTLVREVVQNSIDARRDRSAVAIQFRIIDLVGAHLTKFKKTIQWASLVDNLQAVQNSRGGESIERGIDRLESEKRLRLLVIEDRNTKGLEGSEERIGDTPNPFCALVRDELYSDKADAGSGGSFGLGKSMLWAHSVFNTVLFSSVPKSPPQGCAGSRFIGSVILPWHETTQDGPCSGRGWLGSNRGKTQRAESEWFTEPDRTLDALCCPRRGDPGLSAVIVGFEEPGGDPQQDGHEILGLIRRSAIESFWPALVRKDLEIMVSVEENDITKINENVDPHSDSEFLVPCSLLEAFDGGQVKSLAQLSTPGDYTIQMVDLNIPECIESGNKHPEFTCQIPVLIQLLENDFTGNKVLNMVQRFRKPGMIVRGDRRANLSFDARPFTALVLGGTASGFSPQNENVERFLRASEPPAHDKWTHETRAIKDKYKARGVKKMLGDFEDAIRAAIRKVIAPPRDPGGKLPNSILKHLRFGAKTGGPTTGFLRVTHSLLSPNGTDWDFSFKCRRADAGPGRWRVTVGFKLQSDGGRGERTGDVDIEDNPSLFSKNSGSEVVFLDGVSEGVIKGRIKFSSGIGMTLRSAVSLQIDGKVV